MKLFFRIIFKIFLILSILVGCATTEDTLLYQGIALLEEGQYDHAIACFNRVIEINPRHADAYNNRGLAYSGGKGQYDQGISDFNKAIEINEKDAWAYNNRGLAYAEGKGQYDKAISDYNKAIEINPRHVAAYYNRGMAYAKGKGQYDKAIPDFTKFLEINPMSVEAYNNRGVAYFRIKEYEKAWDDVHKAQNLGYNVHPGFLKALREASGREK
jgi:tetratricopeptide (TPR) repeat protein